MSKHTPGPWKLIGLNINKHVLICQEGKENCTPKIAHVIYNGDDNTNEQLANAILISLAPELKQALQGMIKWAEATIEPTLGSDMLPRGIDRWKQLLEKADYINEISTNSNSNTAG